MRVLLAEDNVRLARATEVILEKNGLTVEVVHDGPAALSALKGGYFDVAVLDIMMPGLDGLEVLRRVRAEGNDVPVILLTAKTQVDDKVVGLEDGADDYITKPYDSRELVARIRAAARHRSGASPKVCFGDLVIGEDDSTLSTREGSLSVNQREAQMAALLAHAGGKKVDTSWLSDRVWDGAALDGEVELYASYLNGKLEALGSDVKVEGSADDGWRMVESCGA
ncbi:MAG: response regulator transcription factor [Olsenella sp.]|jgi:DNA-binding response OmpR family regulator|nr:response regulator transcription factor [Olsenella sp.]MCI1288282.1 response regulator transcription factor [Olsenella sp.]